MQTASEASAGSVFSSPDVVGIGALNVDYIGRAPVATADWTQSIVNALSAMVPRLEPPLRWNTERVSAEHPVEAPSWAIPPDEVTVALGGSAFNTIHALARLRVGITTGYVGVAGDTPPSVTSFEQTLDTAGVDRTLVRSVPSQHAGVCLSVMEHGEPTMLTYPGVNVTMAEYLAQEFDRIMEYLCSARVIHVTSLLDPDSPGELLRILREVKRRNPAIVVSFDPGFSWCVGSSDLLREFGQVSDIVSMNRLELFAAVEYSSLADDEHAARVVLKDFMASDGILIARAPGGVTCHRATGGDITSKTYRYVPLNEREIIDATGAGDVFAAGFLAGYLATPEKLDVGVQLGINLARTHLQYLGTGGYQYFPEIAARWLRSK